MPKSGKDKASARERAKSELWRLIVGNPSGHADLWKRVVFWRERLKQCDDYPVLSGLEWSWRLLEADYGDLIGRGDTERAADTPLAALFYYIDSGFYPPPEILLSLHDAYEVYKAAGGLLSLEEAFFGPPRRKAGNYARRKAERFRRLSWGLSLAKLMNEGHSKAKAAEVVADQYKGTYEPETIARRAIMPRFKRRRELPRK